MAGIRSSVVRLSVALASAFLLFGCTSPGAAPEPEPVAKPTRHLAVAEAAGRWLIANARHHGDAWTWPPCPDEARRDEFNLYSGSAGVALLFCELHEATGDAIWLQAAHATARGLAANFPAAQKQGAGLFVGAGGPLLAMQVVWERTNDPQLDETIRSGLAWYEERAKLTDEAPSVSFGPVTDIISGDAGIGELMLWFAERRPDSRAKDIAAGIARHFVAIAEPMQPGFRWKMSKSYARAMPNYSHGTGGVTAFLARARHLHPEALSKARGGAEWLRHLADQRGMVFHHQPGGEQLFYWGWCHGPAGTSVMFSRLANATGDASFAADAKKPLAAVMASGLPTTRLPGLWNTVGQCCGTAGVGAYLLREAKGDADSMRVCEEIADDIAARGTKVFDGMKWVQAEHRVRPDLLQAQIGWAQGASGIGLWFLQLDAALRGRSMCCELPWTTVE